MLRETFLEIPSGNVYIISSSSTKILIGKKDRAIKTRQRPFGMSMRRTIRVKQILGRGTQKFPRKTFLKTVAVSKVRFAINGLEFQHFLTRGGL